MPKLPVPLRAPDPDVLVNLATIFSEVYTEAAYDLSIDYQQPPPPPALSEAERAWVRALLEQDSDPGQRPTIEE